MDTQTIPQKVAGGKRPGAGRPVATHKTREEAAIDVLLQLARDKTSDPATRAFAAVQILNYERPQNPLGLSAVQLDADRKWLAKQNEAKNPA